MNRDVYETCPEYENKEYLLRLVQMEDATDLLKVYSDEKAVPLFNSDNCDGDLFHYETIERMKQAIQFWIDSYKNRWFVRWAIIDKATKEAIGTIELFHRDSNDYFNHFGVLRLDLQSDYEREVSITDILKLILPKAYELFECQAIATKASKEGQVRRKALTDLGFVESNECLVGNDGTKYQSYFVRGIGNEHSRGEEGRCSSAY